MLWVLFKHHANNWDNLKSGLATASSCFLLCSFGGVISPLKYIGKPLWGIVYPIWGNERPFWGIGKGFGRG